MTTFHLFFTVALCNADLEPAISTVGSNFKELTTGLCPSRNYHSREGKVNSARIFTENANHLVPMVDSNYRPCT